MEIAQEPVVEQNGRAGRPAQERLGDVALFGFEEIAPSGDVSRNETFRILV